MRPFAVLGTIIATSAALVSSAQAGVIANPVTASVTLAGSGGSVNYTNAINRQINIGDTGTVIGTFGTNADIRGRWSAQMVGAAGSGANGGNVYAIAVQIGSSKRIGPFARDYQDAVLLPTDQIGGSVITNASLGFGVGGGGLKFDDFGGVNQILIDNTGTFGDAAYSMRTDPNFAGFGVTGVPSLMSTYASIAADGSVGFATSFDVSSLWVNPDNVSSLFNGNLAEWEVRGFNSSFFVEVVAVPAPGAMALLGLAGLAGRRRR
jgi:hypothetical protein